MRLYPAPMWARVVLVPFGLLVLVSCIVLRLWVGVAATVVGLAIAVSDPMLLGWVWATTKGRGANGEPEARPPLSLSKAQRVAVFTALLVPVGVWQMVVSGPVRAAVLGVFLAIAVGWALFLVWKEGWSGEKGG
jgi:hypothetical protein